MRHVVGLSNVLIPSDMRPLDLEGRLRFDTSDQRALGYFEIISRGFDEFSNRDSGVEITSLHAFFRLSGNDLSQARDVLNRIEAQVVAGPESWRPFLGTCQRGQGPVIRMEPLLFKRRTLGLLRNLQALVLQAAEQGKAVCYGNGAAYRAFCDVRLPPGGEYYS
jgi:hypothetical protein